MKVLTETADMRCNHQAGIIDVIAGQSLLQINGRNVMVERAPIGRPVSGCPHVGPTIKPCTATVNVITGYSELVQIDGRRICLDTITGLTDGTPPGIVRYKVVEPGQQLVDEVPK